MSDDTALDLVLLAYREMFGVKTEKGNLLHRDACIEAYRLRQIEAAARAVLTDGHTPPPLYMDLRDHDEALARLAAALEEA